MAESRAFSVREFAERNSISVSKVYLEIASGRLRAVKIGRRTAITATDAIAWLKALPAITPAAA